MIRTHKMNSTLLLAICSSFIFAIWSWLVPFDGGPDEIHHYEIVRFIAHYFRWPVFGPDRDLYMRVVPGTRDGWVFGFYALYPTYPYLIPALLMRLSPLKNLELHFARLASVGYGVLTVIALYRAALLIFPKSVSVRRLVPALSILIPQSAYLFSYINQDSFGIMAISILFWALSVIKNTNKPSLWNWLAVAVAWGLTTMTRQHIWVFGTLMVISFWQWLSPSHHRNFTKLIGIAVVPAFVLLCWFLRNYLVYSDPILYKTARVAWITWLRVVGFPVFPSFSEQGYSWAQFLFYTSWAWETFKSFWAKFGYMNVEIPGKLYLIYGIFLLVSLICFVYYMINRRDMFLAQFLSLVIVLVLLHAYKNYTGDFQPQGRYLMIAQPVIFSIISIGLYQLKQNSRFAFILIIFLIVLIHLSILISCVPKIPGLDIK
jgi:hypothetical protein